MDDAWYHIIRKLPFKEKIRLERVCKLWQAISWSQFKALKSIDTGDLYKNVPNGQVQNCLMSILGKKIVMFEVPKIKVYVRLRKKPFLLL